MTSYSDYQPLEAVIANISLELPGRDPDLFDMRVKIQDGKVHIQSSEFTHLVEIIRYYFSDYDKLVLTGRAGVLTISPRVISSEWRHTACKAIAQVIMNELERCGYIVKWEDYDAKHGATNSLV